MSRNLSLGILLVLGLSLVVAAPARAEVAVCEDSRLLLWTSGDVSCGLKTFCSNSSVRCDDDINRWNYRCTWYVPLTEVHCRME